MIDGQALENIASHKHLGLVLNNKLTWRYHIDSVSTGANKKLNIIAQLKRLLDRKSLHIMYESFIRPSLEYGNTIYCNCTELETDSIESIQQKAMGIISGGTIITPNRCLHEELAMETLQTRRDRTEM